MSNQETEHREEQAIDLRVRGASYREIAQELGFAGGSGAFKALRRGLRSLPVPDTAETRSLEIRRAEALYTRALEQAEKHKWPAVWFKVLLEIADRLHRLHGLFPVVSAGAPQRTIFDVLTDSSFLAWLEEEKHSKPPVGSSSVLDVVPGRSGGSATTEPRKVVGLGARLPHDEPDTANVADDVDDVDAAEAPRASAAEPAEGVRIDSRAASVWKDLHGTCGWCGGIGCGECRREVVDER